MFSTENIIKVSTFVLVFWSFACAVPVVQKGYVLVPIREVQESGPRQGIIAGWIQNSQFFPVEINIPEVISNVSNGVQQFGQNIGQGIQSAGQNVGQGLQTWISNLGQRFPIINRVPFLGNQNHQLAPQKVLVFIPPKKSNDLNRVPYTSELFTYP